MSTLLAISFMLLFATPPQTATTHLAQAALDSTTARLDSSAVVKLLEQVRNGACPLPGLATGGQPDSSMLAALANNGFRIVLDLRAPEEIRGFEETRVALALGLRYLALPVTSESLSDSTFDSFRALLRANRGEQLFVHCASGNRVGAMLLPWLVLDQGWSVERATTMAQRVGMRSEDLRARALQYITSMSRRRDAPAAQPSRNR